MNRNKIKSLMAIGLVGFLLVAASGLYSVTRYTSGHHISDSRNANATGTPVLMVDGKGAGVAFEVRDSATPVFRIPDGGGFSFPAGGNITLGGGLAADASLIYDGNAQDFHITLDDSSDDLVIGLGSAPDTTNALVIDANLDITLCDATASDCDITYDGIAQDFYIALDDSEDDLVIGLGSTVGTTPIIRLDELLDVTLCDASASDCDVTWDGIAQDFYIALDDNVDDFIIGLGAVIGTTPIISMDENQDVTIAERVIINGVQGADSAVTNETLEVAFTSPVDTTGTNTHNAVTVDLAIGNSTGGTNVVTGLRFDPIIDDPQVVEKAINIGDEWDYAIDTGLPVVASAMYWFDDFIGDTVLAQYTEASGTDAEAVQTIVEEQFGVYQLTSGNAGVNTAGDAEQVSLSLEWQPDQGAMVFETRLHLDTAITNVELCVGLTDNVALELPFTNASDVITAVANDAVAFCFDTNATTLEWFALGVASTTKATGNAATGTAPTADIYQTLRIEIDDGGADCRFYIGGALVGTLTANCVTVTVALAPVVVISSAQNVAGAVVDVDYILVGAARD